MRCLSSIFHNVDEEYIDIPSIKKFCKKNKINLHGKSDKASLIEAIENYASLDEDKREQVLDWVDLVAKEGIKEIQIKYCELPTNMELMFSNEKSISEYLDHRLTSGLSRHLCGNVYDYNKYQFVKYGISNGEHGKCVTLYFCKRLLFVETKFDKMTTREVDFPIIAEYYYEKSWLFIRYKSRPGLFYYDPAGYTIDSKRIRMTLELSSISAWLDDVFQFEKWDENSNSVKIKHKIYQILAKYTSTPSEISNIIQNSSGKIQDIITIIASISSVPLNIKLLEKDLNNLVEKYLSITWPDKQIFIKDREAYPIRLCAIDEESSRVDQTAGKCLPLQSKEVFFDNKRMLEQQQYCESVQFMWDRKNPEYYNHNFPVKIYEERGICKFKFSDFTSEEDIENVLFSIIDA